MIVVGLTGNLASGKSEAARIFKRLGARVFDADEAARKLTRKGTPIYKAVLKMFGRGFIAKSGEIDRKKLARHVFSRPRDLKKLNILIHPGVILEAYKALEGWRGRAKVAVLDVPLLFESKMEKLAHVTVLVTAKESVLLRRAEKKGLPRGLAKKILASQWPAPKKAKLADFVIENDGTPARFKARVKKVYREIVRADERKPSKFWA